MNFTLPRMVKFPMWGIWSDQEQLLSKAKYMTFLYDKWDPFYLMASIRICAQIE